jgi:hypothetical protein
MELYWFKIFVFYVTVFLTLKYWCSLISVGIMSQCHHCKLKISEARNSFNAPILPNIICSQNIYISLQLGKNIEHKASFRIMCYISYIIYSILCWKWKIEWLYRHIFVPLYSWKVIHLATLNMRLSIVCDELRFNIVERQSKMATKILWWVFIFSQIHRIEQLFMHQTTFTRGKKIRWETIVPAFSTTKEKNR